ncbi:HAD hydrolase-like protein [Desulfobacter postgatei]|uniref:Haloacid dehalogenase superfamily enzyme, subfamily IA n=1 Tax=Desulfobacter postgatei 2ac9 TaxID=879212 RepID=I5B5W5_9BACT|nr:HAD hydrolase-like protein [Desulfobacter postgatei]EIM64878.1 hypothetical protein DespoDRAFT_03070 [Desulfobacter postgatei 2ac9]
MLKTFDIFDTLLCRCFVHPIELFEFIEWKYNIPQFGKHRPLAELDARKELKFESEVTIEDIYRFLKTQLNLTSEKVARLIELEKYEEVRCLKPIRLGHERLRQSLVEGNDIGFISDIYLDRATIMRALNENGVPVADSNLYLSSELKGMKSNGKLFRAVIEARGIEPDQIFHVGDNLRSDVEMAQEEGLNAELFKYMEANRYEKHGNNSHILIKLAHGVARQVRLSKEAISCRKHDTIYDVSVSLVGPLVFAFAYWCLREADKKNITNLYFLSRDGQIISEVAKLIGKSSFPKIHVRYLFVSRQALLLPAMTELVEEEFEWILAPTYYFSLNIVFKRVGLQPEAYREGLQKVGLGMGFDEQLDEEARIILKEFFRSISSDILKIAAEKRKLLVAYLAQEGFLAGTNKGIVDVGWSGTLQRSLSRIIGIEDFPESLTGFYFGITRKKTLPQDPMLGWFFDLERKRDLINNFYIIPVVELFFAANHGGVIDYYLGEKDIKVNLRYERNDRALKWGLYYQHKGILDFAERFLQCSDSAQIDDVPELFADEVERTLKLFFTDPTIEEARAYGAYEDAEDQNESYFVRLAKGYDFYELIDFFRHGKKHHHNEWLEAAFVLSRRDFVDFVRRYVRLCS